MELPSVSDVYARIDHKITTQNLSLPTLPEIAQDVRRVSKDEDSSIDDLVAVLSEDASVCARVIQVVNSPLLRVGQKIGEIKVAVTRLGMDYTANLVSGVVVDQLFTARHQEVYSHLRALWRQSQKTAGVCHWLAPQCGLNPDQASLAGLTYLIGYLPVLREIDETLSSDQTGQPVIDLINSFGGVVQGRIGERILSDWDFPDQLSPVPRQAQIPDHKALSPIYADLVLAAEVLTGVLEIDLNRPEEFTFLERVGLDLDDPEVKQSADEAAQTFF